MGHPLLPTTTTALPTTKSTLLRASTHLTVLRTLLIHPAGPLAPTFISLFGPMLLTYAFGLRLGRPATTLPLFALYTYKLLPWPTLIRPTFERAEVCPAGPIPIYVYVELIRPAVSSRAVQWVGLRLRERSYA